MSVKVQFHFLGSDVIRQGGQTAVVSINHYGSSREVPEQCFGTDPSIESWPLPTESCLYNSDPEAEMTEKRFDACGEPLRYTTVKRLGELKMPEWVGPFDHALMAYIEQFAKEAPDTLVILERW